MKTFKENHIQLEDGDRVVVHLGNVAISHSYDNDEVAFYFEKGKVLIICIGDTPDSLAGIYLEGLKGELHVDDWAKVTDGNGEFKDILATGIDENIGLILS